MKELNEMDLFLSLNKSMAASPDHITAPANAQAPALGQVRMGEVKGKDGPSSVSSIRLFPFRSCRRLALVAVRESEKNWLLRA